MTKVTDTLYDSFVSFLKEFGCERQLRSNFYSFNRCTAFCRDIWDVMCGDEYFINRSFCWEDTEQGKEYWKKISDSWEERCSTPVKKV